MLGRDRLADEKQLQADLDALMCHMRTTENHFLTITTHIQQLIHPPETSLFANQHVQLHRTTINKTRHQSAEIEHYCTSVVQRWANCEMEGGEVLLKRVTYRILEIFFNSISATNNKVPQVLQEYLRLKMACQKILQDESIHKPYQLIKIVTDYEFKKLKRHIELLAELTNHLQNGDLDSFSKSQLTNFMESRPSNREITCNTRSPFYSTFKITKIKKEKQASKPQIPIATDKMKAASFKKAKAVYDCLKDVMDVNRAQFINDFTAHCEVTKQVLFRELLGKNKGNNAAINDFASKKRRMQHKIKNKGLNSNISEVETQNQLLEQAKSFSATRKNLLLKLKVSDKPPRALPSELFRKTSKFDEIRSRMKSYNRERALEEERAGKATEALLNQNQEETIQMPQCNQSLPFEERLPMLNKRAHSVDQNYKLQEAQTPQVRTLSNSLKINEDLKLKGKGQKVEMLPAKIKLQLKSFNAITSFQVNKKLGKVGQFSKYLYF